MLFIGFLQLEELKIMIKTYEKTGKILNIFIRRFFTYKDGHSF